jgi:hypothetical protein
MTARKSVVEKFLADHTVDASLSYVMVHKNGYWGKGATVSDALCAYNSIVPPEQIDKDMMVWLCTPGARINEHGTVCWPKGELEPIRIQ